VDAAVASIPAWGAANGYDALRLVAEVVSQGRRTSDEVRDALQSPQIMMRSLYSRRGVGRLRRTFTSPFSSSC
jgi:hypothetical protein